MLIRGKKNMEKNREIRRSRRKREKKERKRKKIEFRTCRRKGKKQ
jgi:hypothetical protein